VFRRTVSNAAEVLAVLRKRRHVLALAGAVSFDSSSCRPNNRL
jgi:hypothetical protein